VFLSNLNKQTKTTELNNPQAPSSALTSLRTLQFEAFVLLNPIVSWVLLSKYYIETTNTHD